jgi:hypothetical protein
MHPIERLRYVARSSGASAVVLARETAGGLAGMAFDAPAVVIACRRVVERHPVNGPIWWLASRVLTAPDPVAEAWRSAGLLADDPTAEELSLALPDDATVTVLGWPDQATESFARRGDVTVLVVDVLGEGVGLVRALRRADVVAEVVAVHGLGACVTASDVVLLEASAMGPDGFIAVAGSMAAASVAYVNELPVWLVGGVGRVLPARTWKAMLARRGVTGLDDDDELVPGALVTHVVGPAGLRAYAEAVAVPDCPVAAELLGRR